MIKIRKVRPVAGFKLMLEFSDDTTGVYDLSERVARTGPMIEPLKEPEYFARVFLEDGAPTWPNGYDLAPWALHKELEDAKLLNPASASAAE